MIVAPLGRVGADARIVGLHRQGDVVELVGFDLALVNQQVDGLGLLSGLEGHVGQRVGVSGQSLVSVERLRIVDLVNDLQSVGVREVHLRRDVHGDHVVLRRSEMQGAFSVEVVAEPYDGLGDDYVDQHLVLVLAGLDVLPLDAHRERNHVVVDISQLFHDLGSLDGDVDRCGRGVGRYRECAVVGDFVVLRIEQFVFGSVVDVVEFVKFGIGRDGTLYLAGSDLADGDGVDAVGRAARDFMLLQPGVLQVDRGNASSAAAGSRSFIVRSAGADQEHRCRVNQ